ncbi:MAG TPA: inositol monophosphatase [Rhodospirillaceae bacterium]|nr:inositol monophosphatase [Candidatus Neomarinimicrobiota bacterium]HCX13970.1 inositol monophosphatase [Rhodospirillaceae bacterium]
MALGSALWTVMTGAASKAARTMKRDFGEIEQLQVSRKGPSDFVSAADLKAEKTLRTELEKGRPKFGFLLEESGEIQGADKRHRWIIDPIDGTTNFLHGIPHFAISIGLQMDEEIIAGLVYNPVTNEMFYAEKGKGAFLNDHRLRVSARSDLGDSIIATGIPFRGIPGHSSFLNRLERVMKVTAGVRRMGTASLDLAYVAAGRYDGFWEVGLKPWDIAAGLLLVQEAGGFISDIEGGRTMLATGDVVSANPRIHGPLLGLLKDN